MLEFHHEDCITFMKKLDDNGVDLTLTDIPYDVVNNYECGIREYNKGNADVLTFDLQTFIEETIRITKKSIYVFCSTEQVSQLRGEYAKAGLSTRLCIWEKTNPAPVHGDKFWLSSLECCVFARKSKATFNEHCSSAVWRESIEKQIKHHPTPKPVKLLSRLIKASTTPDDTVFDPCMGSGSTGMAAKATRRNFIGCDLDPEYVRKASEWIDSLTESEIESRWKGVADTKTPGPLDLLL
tara:strand:+ start:3258 stop:3974 length:717 start_codon:yes stop_codon:yes gene_type:complete